MNAQEARDLSDQAIEKIPGLIEEVDKILDRVKQESEKGYNTLIIDYPVRENQNLLIKHAIRRKLVLLGFFVPIGGDGWCEISW